MAGKREQLTSSSENLAGGKTSRRLRRFRKWVSASFTCLLVLAAATIVMLLFMRSQALPVSKMAAYTQMYDIHKQLIGAYGTSQNREFVPLREIAPSLIQATLAIEDRKFYEHPGFDTKGIARAAIVNLKHMAKVQGAGTITQQLARNLYLTHERTWSRKLKETYYAVQMELQLTKDQILEQYLNQIYYGHSTYGIQGAAQLFFGKNASELTLAESALLAGIPKGPRYYSPYYDMDNAFERQRIVLRTMVESGYITRQQADQAAQEQLTILPLEKRESAAAPYFHDYVRNLAIDRLGITEEQFEKDGLRIFTTLDLKAQQIAEEVVREELKAYPDLQAALVAIDPRNGHIKAMVGGRSYAESQFNRALSNARQPGSTFKPFVYLTALKERQFTPVTRFNSEPTTFTYDNGRLTYTPSNYAGKYNGWIDLRTAISKSDNIFAVHSILETGPEQVIAMTRKLGIQSPMDPVPSLALGTFPVSPLEMSAAYGVLANQGVRIEPTAIIRIEDPRGRILYEAQPVQETVIEPEYTYVLTQLMESVFDQGGTGSRVSSVIKRPVAGKTGTTNTDAWMVGYTPELSTAVWVGYDKGRSINSVESHLAAPVFAEFTERTLAAIPPKLFDMPPNVVTVYVDPATGKLANDGCPNSRMEAFVAGTEPAEYCSEQFTEPAREPEGGTKQNRGWWEDLKRWWTS